MPLKGAAVSAESVVSAYAMAAFRPSQPAGGASGAVNPHLQTVCSQRGLLALALEGTNRRYLPDIVHRRGRFFFKNALASRLISRVCFRSAMAFFVKRPCLKAFWFSNGAPEPSAPPCKRQRFLPVTAGAAQGLPLRVLAPQRKARCIASLREVFFRLTGSTDHTICRGELARIVKAPFRKCQLSGP